MKSYVSIEEARDIMLAACGKMPTEILPLDFLYGRILAQDVAAAVNVPTFERSPFDGYAFRAADTKGASKENPVVLKITEEIPAGFFPKSAVTQGTAAKILTGAPIPNGADAVTKHELTKFSKFQVKIFEELAAGDNIISIGEDVRAGTILAYRGERIDGATVATFAAQGILQTSVYARPRAGIISTGTELAEADTPLSGGLIRDTNRYSLAGACIAAGTESVYLGCAGDAVEDIAALIDEGLRTCDIVFTTGGVSVGDYDRTPDALEMAGVEILVRNISMRPGGTCVFGQRDGKLIFCLPGNPASSMTCFYGVALPSLKKSCGQREFLLKKICVLLDGEFKKASPLDRLIRGKLIFENARVRFSPAEQGNVVLHSLIGCDAMALIPAGTSHLSRGAMLDAYLL